MMFFKLNWNNPKRLINSIVFKFSFISLALALIALVFIYKSQQSSFLNSLDIEISDSYSKEISNLHKRILLSQLYQNKIKHQNKLLKKIKGLNSLQKYYPFIKESYEFLIDDYLHKQQTSKALLMAEKWKDLYPYDFDAKFKYADTLKVVDSSASLQFYQKLYKQHNDIYEVISKFVDALLENGEFNKAISIARESQKNLIHNSHISINYYIKDKDNLKYSWFGNQINQQNITINNENYKVDFYFETNGFMSLALFLNNLPLKSSIEILSSKLIIENHEYNSIPINPIADLSLKNNELIVDGISPKFEVIAPNTVIDFTGKVRFSIEIKINSVNTIINKILHHSKWMLSCSKENNFNNLKFKRIYFERKNLSNFSTSKINTSGDNYCKLKFPPIKNMKIKNLLLAENSFDSPLELLFLNDITSLDNGELIIDGSDPFAVYERNRDININNIIIKFKFNKHEN